MKKTSKKISIAIASMLTSTYCFSASVGPLASTIINGIQEPPATHTQQPQGIIYGGHDFSDSYIAMASTHSLPQEIDLVG
jgi:hypothetical protein